MDVGWKSKDLKERKILASFALIVANVSNKRTHTTIISEGELRADFTTNFF